jgi:hypothetical protein
MTKIGTVKTDCRIIFRGQQVSARTALGAGEVAQRCDHQRPRVGVPRWLRRGVSN